MPPQATKSGSGYFTRRPPLPPTKVFHPNLDGRLSPQPLLSRKVFHLNPDGRPCPPSTALPSMPRKKKNPLGEEVETPPVRRSSRGKKKEVPPPAAADAAADRTKCRRTTNGESSSGEEPPKKISSAQLQADSLEATASASINEASLGTHAYN